MEKYRPKELNELVSHTDIISTITKFMDQKKLPHLLFYGPAGTGTSNTGSIICCFSIHVLFVAASHSIFYINQEHEHEHALGRALRISMPITLYYWI